MKQITFILFAFLTTINFHSQRELGTSAPQTTYDLNVHAKGNGCSFGAGQKGCNVNFIETN